MDDCDYPRVPVPGDEGADSDRSPSLLRPAFALLHPHPRRRLIRGVRGRACVHPPARRRRRRRARTFPGNVIPVPVPVPVPVPELREYGVRLEPKFIRRGASLGEPVGGVCERVGGGEEHRRREVKGAGVDERECDLHAYRAAHEVFR